MLNAETVSFEKLIGVVAILVTLTLLACGAFYFRRRITNLESALKDQAKVTQNVLQMMSTMIPSESKEATSIFMSGGPDVIAAVSGWLPHDLMPHTNYNKFVDVTEEEHELIEVSDMEDEVTNIVTKDKDATTDDVVTKVAEDKIAEDKVAAAEDKIAEDAEDVLAKDDIKDDVKEFIQEHPNYEKMKVDELRELIEKRGLPNPGKNKLKKELIQILES